MFRAGTFPSDRRQRAGGFTLTELAVALAIVGILAALTASSAPDMIASSRARTVASDLDMSFAKARSIAVARNTSITVTPASTGWSNGWKILDASSNVLDTHDAVSGATIATQSAGVTYLPSGRLPTGSTAPSFVITGQSGSKIYYQCVSVDASGRPYLVTGQSC